MVVFTVLDIWKHVNTNLSSRVDFQDFLGFVLSDLNAELHKLNEQQFKAPH